MGHDLGRVEHPHRPAEAAECGDRGVGGQHLEAPFGRVPGSVVLGVHLAENLTHGWDLATATGQDPEADPALVAPAYATMQQALPATGREGFPLDAPVEPAADAGPTERLANWSGRRSR